jgi:hypothetical protein
MVVLLLVDSVVCRYTAAMSWWDVDEEARILRARVAKLEAENAELARRFPGPQSNVIPFPNGEEFKLQPVADGTAVEVQQSVMSQRKTNGNGGY